jgi:hypothetical protein
MYKGDKWRKVEWKPLRDGVVKTDIKRPGELEEFTFEPKTVDQLKAVKEERLKALLLAKASGTWVSGARTLRLGASSSLDGNPVTFRAMPCNLSQCGKTELPCAELGKPGTHAMLLQLQGKKLVQVAWEGECTDYNWGVEPLDGGLILERR